MFQATGFNNSALLLELADLLEHGKPIPSELAEACSEVIRVAVTQGGKLDLGKRPGRPNANEEQIERAIAVGHIMGTDDLTEKQARSNLAKRLTIGPRSIVNACKRYPKMVHMARRIAKMDVPGKYKKLETLLHSFRDQNGRPYSQDEIDDMRRRVPFEVIRVVSEKIENSVHRDRKLLREILTSEGIKFDE